MTGDLWQASAFILPFIFSIMLHEIAHGYVALKLGDTTAKNMGRLTLNPIKHVDPFGSIIFPLILYISQSPFLFGWAKPVPVQFNRLNDPKKDMGIVALAGPVTNILLAIIFAFCLKMGMQYFPQNQITAWILLNFQNGLIICLALAAFNLFPILPMDGGRVMLSLLPENLAKRYAMTERYGFVVLISLLIFLPILGNYLHFDLDVIRIYMKWMIEGLLKIVTFIV